MDDKIIPEALRELKLDECYRDKQSFAYCTRNTISF